MESEHCNGLTPSQAELLSFLAEKCAGVIQIVSKIQRRGLHSLDADDPEKLPNRRVLNKELGDVYCAQQLLIDLGILSMTMIAEQAAARSLQIGKHREYYGSIDRP